MKIETLALVLAMAAPCVASAAELYRWTDDGGRVYVGVLADVPERYVSRAVPTSTPLPADISACERRWHDFLVSTACFDQFRVVGGGLKPGAFERCTEVLQPDPCN